MYAINLYFKLQAPNIFIKVQLTVLSTFKEIHVWMQILSQLTVAARILSQLTE